MRFAFGIKARGWLVFRGPMYETLDSFQKPAPQASCPVGKAVKPDYRSFASAGPLGKSQRAIFSSIMAKSVSNHPQNRN